jgi:CHAT domain-containing protein/Tfp pilus assembly protein PilF
MQAGPDQCLISALIVLSSGVGYVCISWLLLNVGFGKFLSSQPQSLSLAPNVSESSAEFAVGTVAERYFARYAANLDGMMSLWSPQSPDYATTREASERQFAAENAKISQLSLSRLRIKGECASLRVALELTVAGQQFQLPQRQVHSFSLGREGGVWNVRQGVSSYDELASALDNMASVEECKKLLAEKNELVDSELVKALNRLAERRIMEGSYEKALKLVQVTLQIAEPLGDLNGEAAALKIEGTVYLNQGRYEQAMTRLQESLRLSEATLDKSGVAAALNDMAFVHQLQDRNEKALETYERSKRLFEELGQRERVASVSSNIADVYVAAGRYEMSLKHLQEALGTFQELNQRSGIASTLSRMGLIDLYQGHYAQALEKFQQSLRMRQELGNRKGIALVHNRIGLAYDDLGLSKLAMENYQKALRLFEDLGDRFNQAEVLLNIGSLLSDQEEYEPAVAYFQRSQRIFEEIGTQGEAARPLHNIGNIYRKQGQFDLGMDIFQKCLKIHEGTRDKLGMTITLKNIALTDYAKGSYVEALEAGRRALALAREINNLGELWRVQECMGRTLRVLGQAAQARQSFLDAIATIESLRQQVGAGAQQQQSFLENKLAPWLGIIDLLLSQHQYAEGLTFAEQSKARVLLDVLQAGRTSLHKSLSLQEHQAEEEQRLRLVALNSELTGELRRDQPDQVRVSELKAGIAKARLEYEALETDLYVAHPHLQVSRGEASIIKADEFSVLLPDAASALLEYVVTEEVTYLFVVTKTQSKRAAEVQVFSLPIKRAELAKRTEVFRQQLARRDLGFRESAHKLYDLLLKSAQSLLHGKTNLVIVPDDQLWELPFQALLAEDNRYLIETAAVSYAPSLTVLREMRAQRNVRPANVAVDLLALGNPAIGKETVERATLVLRDERLDPLPEAEREVRVLGQLYGTSRSKVYIGAEAREDRVKAEAGQARVLHFATHGTLNNAAPMYSHLVLAQGNAGEDGLLEAWELLQLDLKADLAVLSACETARGRFRAGEGMIGLTWALFVAGVPTTVVAQWQIESATTRDLMLHFHRALKVRATAGQASLTKAEALRQAALKLMRSKETSHPFYWAGFVLVGNGG